MTTTDQIKSLQEMINYIESKKSLDKLDRLLVENWKRSVSILEEKMT